MALLAPGVSIGLCSQAWEGTAVCPLCARGSASASAAQHGDNLLVSCHCLQRNYRWKVLSKCNHYWKCMNQLGLESAIWPYRMLGAWREIGMFSWMWFSSVSYRLPQKIMWFCNYSLFWFQYPNKFKFTSKWIYFYKAIDLLSQQIEKKLINCNYFLFLIYYTYYTVIVKQVCYTEKIFHVFPRVIVLNVNGPLNRHCTWTTVTIIYFLPSVQLQTCSVSFNIRFMVSVDQLPADIWYL